jgi:hypothetical protein
MLGLDEYDRRWNQNSNLGNVMYENMITATTVELYAHINYLLTREVIITI